MPHAVMWSEYHARLKAYDCFDGLLDCWEIPMSKRLSDYAHLAAGQGSDKLSEHELEVISKFEKGSGDKECKAGRSLAPAGKDVRLHCLLNGK